MPPSALCSAIRFANRSTVALSSAVHGSSSSQTGAGAAARRHRFTRRFCPADKNRPGASRSFSISKISSALPISPSKPLAPARTRPKSVCFRRRSEHSSRRRGDRYNGSCRYAPRDPRRPALHPTTTGPPRFQQARPSSEATTTCRIRSGRSAQARRRIGAKNPTLRNHAPASDAKHVFA